MDRDDAIIYIGGMDLKKHAKELITSSKQQATLDERLFAHLYPFKETRMQVNDFVAQHFNNKPFVAVHLDRCGRSDAPSRESSASDAQGGRKDDDTNEDSAGAGPGASSLSYGGAISSWLHASANILKPQVPHPSWCAYTSPELLQWALEEHAMSLTGAPIFVSASVYVRNDKPEWIDAFRSVGAVMFDEDCPRLYECEMVNREIAVRAAFFYAPRETDATRYVINMRKWRDNASPFVQFPSLIRNFRISEAKALAGWTTIPPRAPSITPAPPVTHSLITIPNLATPPPHYQAYLAKLDGLSSVYPRDESFPRNGVICQLGTFEQLNNVLDQTAALLHIARRLRRTVVVTPLIAQLYDVSFLEQVRPFRAMRARDGTWYTPARVSTNVSFCDPGHRWSFSKPGPVESLTTFVRRHRRDKTPVLVMGAKSAFHYGFGKRLLFQYLHSQKETREIAINFIEQNFGEKPFVAV
jgi:hypothetical protein